MNGSATEANEVIELRARVARLEALLGAFLASGCSNVTDASSGKCTAAAAESTQAQIDKSQKHGGASECSGDDRVQPQAPSPIASPLPPVPVAMAATRVVMHQLVLPADVNGLGICTGGQVLSWIDLCAGLSAKTLAHGPCVTASVDAVHFLRPTRLGCVVIIAAMVARTFHTSMEVVVVVESEDMRTGLRHHCCSAHLTFVVRPHPAGPGAPAAAGASSGAAGGGGGLPRMVPTTSEHRAVWEGAELRRQQRLERRARLRNNPELKDAERTCRLQPITHREGGPTLPPAVTLLQTPARPSPHTPAVTQPTAQRSESSQGRPEQVPASSPAVAPAPNVGGGGAIAPSADKLAGGGRGDGDPPESPLVPPPLPLPPVSPPAPVVVPHRQRVPPGCTTAYMTQSILPQHANTLNITFGGQVMSWIEQCAYISASRLRAPSLLTAAMDSVTFARPTRVGDILYITAQVTAIFGSSLEVMVSVHGESPYVGAGSSGAAATAAAPGVAGGSGAAANGGNGDGCGIFHCADAYVTVVAVDERHASPVPVPFELDPKEPADVLRYQGAMARRAERLTLRGQFAAAECTRVSLDGGHTYSPPPEPAEGASVMEAIPPL